VGGPHCVAMCGAACAGIGQAAAERRAQVLTAFQLGRVLGYSALGGIAAASMQALGWLTVYSAALRPLWSLLHVAALVLGLVLLWQARQPVWLDRGTRRLWQAVQSWTRGRGRWAPLLLGALWALLPCGLLYSALLVAALTGQALSGAVVMGMFALGTAVSMTLAPWLWLRLKGGGGDLGVRLAGLALTVSSAWALWMGLVHNQAPWCVTP